MAAKTNIEWCDHTFNPFIGCTKVSPGCDHCYAEAMMDKRMHKVVWGAGQPRVRTSAANWKQPLRWNAQHEKFFAKHGRRQRVFCASLADIFDNEVPEQWRIQLFDLIFATPNLDWLLLTKRIGNAASMLPNYRERHPMHWGEGWPNVWIGATVVNQEEADRDIPKLLATPAAKRFLSMEPLLSEVDLLRTGAFGCTCAPRETADGFEERCNGTCAFYRSSIDKRRRIDWVIVGGESGGKARPMHEEWALSLRDQCADAGVPFLFKQWGEYGPAWVDNAPFGSVRTMIWQGKKIAGRELDGVQHDGFPELEP